LVANFLQKYTLQFFGPFLIIIGMMLTGILLPNQHTMRLATRLLRKTPRSGIWGGFSLGVLIALSFCPMSAAIFFGVLIPLAVSSESTILYPVLFGVGSSFPLVVITLIISSGTTFFTRLSTAKKSTEKKVRLTAGLILILLGIYLTLRHIYNVI
ncbi:MAG: cytochrome c biogenesis protein CcdA, partial [bacterium]